MKIRHHSLRILAAVVVIFLVGSSAALYGASPLGGLTVAVSSDGSKLVAAGDSRTLLILDPETLEVKKRVWTQLSITAITFSRDGARLIALDTSNALHVFGTEDWSKQAEYKEGAAFTTNGELIAGSDGKYDGRTVFVRRLADGVEIMSASFEKGVEIAALALSEDGARLAVLTAGAKDESEKEVPYAEIPKDLDSDAKDEFKQKNDGKTSRLFFYDTATGDQVSEATTFYTTSGQTLMFFRGPNLIALNYSNLNATITPEGEATIFKLENSFNYGIGLSWDKSMILTGGLGNFSLTDTDSLTAVTGKADKLPSWPEYWKGFAATVGGAIYGGTTAYRVFKIKPSGEVEIAQPAG